MILSLVDKDLIFLNKKFDHQKEVFEYMYQKLYKKGYVKINFIAEILKRERKFPTGLELGYGLNIAIPHTDPEYAKESFIAIMVLNEPIKFQKMDDPEVDVEVKMVIMLAITEQGKHVEILGELMNFIQDQDLIESILNAQTPINVIEEIKKKYDFVLKGLHKSNGN